MKVLLESFGLLIQKLLDTEKVFPEIYGLRVFQKLNNVEAR